MAVGVGCVRLVLDGSSEARLLAVCFIATTLGTGLYVIAARAFRVRELDLILRRRRA
jgi:hypothetical protein